MPRRAPRHNTTGRRGSLTPERHQTIINLVAAGNYATTACAAAGIAPATLYSWETQGREAREALANGEPLPERARKYVDFVNDLEQARAAAEVAVVETIHKDIHGGVVIEEEPMIHPKTGEPVRDDDGNIMYRRRVTPPNGRTALAFLAVTRPDRFGKPAQEMQVSGPGGGPITVTVEHALAQRVAGVLEARRVDEAGEWAVEAEVVDERMFPDDDV